MDRLIVPVIGEEECGLGVPSSTVNGNALCALSLALKARVSDHNLVYDLGMASPCRMEVVSSHGRCTNLELTVRKNWL